MKNKDAVELIRATVLAYQANKISAEQALAAISGTVGVATMVTRRDIAKSRSVARQIR